MAKFKRGDIVRVLPHRTDREDGTVEHRLAVVMDPCRPTDMKSITGEPVGHYVDVQFLGEHAWHGFHESSLEIDR